MSNTPDGTPKTPISVSATLSEDWVFRGFLKSEKREGGFFPLSLSHILLSLITIYY
jgi:hypothetical protein